MILRLIILLPIMLILVLFALSNVEPVQIGIWPTDYAIEVPLSIAVLVGAAVAFLLGGLLVWLGEFGLRRRARRAEERARVLQERLQELEARSTVRPLAPPT